MFPRAPALARFFDRDRDCLLGGTPRFLQFTDVSTDVFLSSLERHQMISRFSQRFVRSRTAGSAVPSLRPPIAMDPRMSHAAQMYRPSPVRAQLRFTAQPSHVTCATFGCSTSRMYASVPRRGSRARLTALPRSSSISPRRRHCFARSIGRTPPQAAQQSWLAASPARHRKFLDVPRRKSHNHGRGRAPRPSTRSHAGAYGRWHRSNRSITSFVHLQIMLPIGLGRVRVTYSFPGCASPRPQRRP
jgi:hypothetical protein